MAKEGDVLSHAEILKKLLTLGYFGDKKWAEIKDISGARLERAIKEFQAFHGLDEDGIVGPRTANRMNRKRCGLPDFELRLEEGICQWPKGLLVTYATALTLPGLTKEQSTKAYDLAAAQWMEVCGLRLKRITDFSAANIAAKSGTGRPAGLDGRGGTLAWSELPCGATPESQMAQMYDAAEDWSFNMAVAVICHEMGHALGLPHLPTGNLMAPYYDPNVTKPQKGDAKEMVARYGKVTTAPVPAPGPVSPPGLNVGGEIVINGQPFVLVPKT